MPDVTSPHTVYWPSRKPASSKQMQNCELALLGFIVRAIEQTPRTLCSRLNSAGSSGLSEPPVPVPVGSPPCALVPGRSEERRVGKECVSSCGSRCTPDHIKKQIKHKSTV